MPISFEQEDAYWRATSEAEEVPLRPPESRPCATCPWKLRFAGDGAPNPYFLHVPTTVRDLWRGYRSPSEQGGMADGLVAMCHRATHGDFKRPGEQFDSFTPCCAALAVQEREAIRWHEREPSLFGPEAAARVARRWMGVPERLFLARILSRADLVSRAHPLIADARIGHPDAPARPGEFEFEPLPMFDVRLPRALSEAERERIERVAGFGVQADGETVRVLASSEKVAALWLAERLGLVPASA